MSACWNPDDCCMPPEGGRCSAPWKMGVDMGSLEQSVIASLSSHGMAILKHSIHNVELVNPTIVYTQPEPRKPSLDEQCEAAMARLKAHINSRCAEHSYALRANGRYAINKMHWRHNVWHIQVLARSIRADLVLAGLLPVHVA